MTGRELIIFVMENHLEDVTIFDGNMLPGLMTLDEAAVKWHSGRNTLKALFEMGKLPGVVIDEKLYMQRRWRLSKKFCMVTQTLKHVFRYRMK